MLEGKKLLLVQPHSDDILFSASEFLFNKDKYKDITILTVEYNDKRILEDKKLCDHFNISLDLLESEPDSTNFHKEYYSQHSSLDDTKAMKFCKDKMGAANLLEMAEELSTICLKYIDKGYKVVTCLGVGHPFHWLVKEILEDISSLFYRDFPHSYKRRNKEYLNYLISKGFEMKYLGNPEKNHDKKFELIKDIYKSQSSLLFFEQNYIKKRLPEEFFILKGK